MKTSLVVVDGRLDREIDPTMFVVNLHTILDLGHTCEGGRARGF